MLENLQDRLAASDYFFFYWNLEKRLIFLWIYKYIEIFSCIVGFFSLELYISVKIVINIYIFLLLSALY